MRNPYDDERDLTDYRISTGAAWWVIGLFLLVLAALPVWDLVSKLAGGRLAETTVMELLTFEPKPEHRLRDHLADFERSLDKLGYAVTIRRNTQQMLTRQAGEGNRRVFPGRDGWLFYRPELQALNGWGPLKREPFSVMKDPALAKLRPARELVLKFAAQLKERGIPLLLVPLPVKPMLYPEHLLTLPPDKPLVHPDQAAFFDELRAAGIDVLDVTQTLFDLKKRHPLFLKQDTHWTPLAMKKTAQLVGTHIKKSYPGLADTQGTPIVDGRIHDRDSLGDLVGLLDLAQPEKLYPRERAQLVSISGMDPDRASPVVLLGDSFVNIYTDASLGFADPAETADPPPLMNAGFAYQLALSLGRPLDVIAKNGAGTTATRREFAARPDDEVRAKKLVVWVLAGRDLLYSPAAAREANIDWEPVTFNPNMSRPSDLGRQPAATAGTVVVEAELVEKSKNEDPNATPYSEALHTATYQVSKVISGDFDAAAEWQAVQWTFKGRVLQPTAKVRVGGRYRLTLSPWDQQKALQGLEVRNDNTSLDEFTTERWYVESLEEL